MDSAKRSGIDLILEDQEKREARSAPVEIITLNDQKGTRALAQGLPGTVHIVLARQNSGAIASLRESLGDEAQFREAVEKMLAPYRRKKALKSAALARLTIRQPVFAELRSAGERLHSGLFVPPGAQAIPLVFPYNGGPLPESLELVEYVKQGENAGLEAIALKCDPELTAAEAAALKLAPKDQHGRNIGRSADCDTTWMVVVAVAAAAVAIGTLTIATATAGCNVMKRHHHDDESMRRLPPGASARRLLETRRKALVDAKARAKGRRKRRRRL